MPGAPPTIRPLSGAKGAVAAALLAASAMDAIGYVLVVTWGGTSAPAVANAVLVATQGAAAAVVGMALWRLARSPGRRPGAELLKWAWAERRSRTLIALSAVGTADLALFLWSSQHVDPSATAAVFYCTYSLTVMAGLRRRRRAGGRGVALARFVYAAFGLAAAGCWMVLLGQHETGWAASALANTEAAAGIGLAVLSGFASGTSTCLAAAWTGLAAETVQKPGPLMSAALVSAWQAARQAVAVPALAALAWLSATHGWLGYTSMLTIRQAVFLAGVTSTVWLGSGVLLRFANTLPAARPAHNLLPISAFVMAVLGLAWTAGLELPRPGLLAAGAGLLLAANAWAQTAMSLAEHQAPSAYSGMRSRG